MTKYRIFAFLLVIVLLLTGCKGVAPDSTEPPETTETKPKPHVLYGWTGEYSDENFRKTIETYLQDCTPYVSDGTNGNSVSFEMNLEVVGAGVSRLTGVDDRDVAGELSGYLCTSVDVTHVDGRITVATDWWHKDDGWTRDIPIWSYLVCVKDKTGAKHYCYFRVKYSTPQDNIEYID